VVVEDVAICEKEDGVLGAGVLTSDEGAKIVDVCLQRHEETWLGE
jgi:hypothetical protein